MEARLLSLEGQFWIPGYRELFASSGACAATKRGMESLLGRPGGVISVLVVGGAPESLNSDKEKIRLVLKKRKGFIKLALRYGVNLVPTFSFGEAFIYGQIPNPEGSLVRRIQDYLQHIVGFAPVLFFGRGVFQYAYGIVPFRKPITLVVGKPILVQRVQNPSNEDIESLHSRYVSELTKLYSEYNPVYGDVNVELVIT
ncbi:2-acylglycerol O-acyltransferase 1 [Eurytemora carolleeae]|uniref:2-acylglycerol O-acyltransferase 1 n=1 Tax=Eurytemora carolleeae TaxID=1294199 RepID=UPI000C789FB9|nr:2-acylglycerol O-acyltransferase 1 [Eurytemora carolleeae]|eukprot:XP_023320700.1 2-acylglycerol O-acyltransferase 1-like [Eurytemora affinis]